MINRSARCLYENLDCHELENLALDLNNLQRC